MIDFKWPLDKANLIERVNITPNAPMNTKYTLINNRC